jgi:hypothetical protein
VNQLISAGDVFIWLTSVLTGGLVCLGGYRWLAAKSLPAQSRALLGEWFGYGHFHSREGDLFYKENISITRDWLRPWRLRVMARPDEEGVESAYRGSVTCVAPFIFCSGYEPVFGDVPSKLAVASWIAGTAVG